MKSFFKSTFLHEFCFLMKKSVSFWMFPLSPPSPSWLKGKGGGHWTLVMSVPYCYQDADGGPVRVPSSLAIKMCGGMCHRVGPPLPCVSLGALPSRHRDSSIPTNILGNIGEVHFVGCAAANLFFMLIFLAKY